MSKIDPTNQGKNRKKAIKDVNARLNNASKNTLSLWKGYETPKRTVRKVIQNNADLVYWEYDMISSEVISYSQ